MKNIFVAFRTKLATATSLAYIMSLSISQTTVVAGSGKSITVLSSVKVEIWKDGKYKPIRSGDRLKPTDTLRIQAHGNIKISCYDKNYSESNTKKQPIIRNVGSNICEGYNPYKPEAIAIRVGGHQDTVPYVISPRFTELLLMQPFVLRWHSVEGISSYNVEIFEQGNEEKSVWSSSYSSSPKNDIAELLCKSCSLDEKKKYFYEEFSKPIVPQKPFSPLSRYRLVITPIDATSNSPKKSDSSDFEKVGDDYSEPSCFVKDRQFSFIANDPQPIDQEIQELSTESKAVYYANKCLHDKAIQTILTALLQQPKKGVKYYRILGDIYSEIGLTQLAKGAYEQTRQLAGSEGEDLAEKEHATAYLKKTEELLKEFNNSIQIKMP
jgi:hypothetical protein